MKARLQVLMFFVGASIFVLGCISPPFFVAMLSTSILDRESVEESAAATLDARTTPNAVDLLWGMTQPTLQATSTPSVESLLQTCQMTPSLTFIIEACSQVLLFDPTNLTARLNRGIAYSKFDQYAEAIIDLNIVLASLDSSEGYYWRGSAYMNLSQLEDALEDFNRTLELEPDYLRALSSRAYTYRILGNFTAALTDYQRILELDGDTAQDALAHFGIGHVEMIRRNFDATLEHYEAALQLTPNDLAIRSNRAMLLVMMGRYQHALQEIPAILEQDNTYFAFLHRNLLVAQLFSDNADHLTEAQTLLEAHLNYLQYWDLIMTAALDVEGVQTVTIQPYEVVQIPVELTENQTYRITARAQESGLVDEYPSVNPFLMLVDEQGQILAYNNDSTDSTTLERDIWESVIVYDVATSGAYRILVFNENGIEPSGNVEITLSATP